MERIENESVRLFCPAFADELVRREAFERLQPASEIVGGDEIGEMRPQLVVRFVEVSFDRRILDRAVHAFDLTVRPGMLWFRQPMVDVVTCASEFEGMRAEGLPARDHFPDV